MKLSRPVAVFATQHPAALLRNPKESVANSIKDQLCLCQDAVTNAVEENLDVASLPPDEFLAAVRAERGRILCLDIETYGIRPGRTQTAFHPAMSARLDGVPVGEQLESCAFGLAPKDGRGRILTTAFLVRQFPQAVEEIINAAIAQGHLLYGMNILFDLSYILAATTRIPRPLPRSLGLIDLGVVSFCENPDRPERSLKDIAPLLLRSDYAKYGPRGSQYANDDELLEYNRRDVVNPIALFFRLLRRMQEQKLPPDPWSLLSFYSDELHSLLHMVMVGVTMDAEETRTLLSRWEKRADKLATKSEELRGVKVKGEGSQASVQAVFNKAVEDAPSDVEWELTEKAGRVSTGKANLRRAVAHCRGSATTRQLHTLSRYRSASKLVSSYLRPLSELMVGNVGPQCLLYPSWFPVPSRFEVSDDEGGTRQGRPTCRRPALQTSPSIVKGLTRSRFAGGELWSYDYSQLELRDLALVSGDPEMIAVYARGGDIHQETLEAVMGRQVSRGEPHYDRLRRQAKYTNFGIGYGITAPALQEAWWKYFGIVASRSEAAMFIHGFKRKYRMVPDLHCRLIAEVQRTGHLVLPVTGHWLSFADPASTGELDKAILNFPIQAMAAILCLIAQGLVIELVTTNHWGVVPMNVYDAIHVDYRSSMIAEYASREVSKVMTDNWYVQALCAHYGRRVPFVVDAKRLN
jgi:DNA polymerase I-like protein with 3'-5' exonuclease and polymerase domains